MKRGDEIILPNGRCARVELCEGRGITVWLVNANDLPFEKRWVWIDKKDLEFLQ